MFITVYIIQKINVSNDNKWFEHLEETGARRNIFHKTQLANQYILFKESTMAWDKRQIFTRHHMKNR